MTHQLELLNICKEFKIDPIKHKKLSMLFKWQHKAIAEFLEMERPIMIIIILSRLTKNGRTINFMSNLIWDGSETKEETKMATKFFNDCADEVSDSIGSCLRASEPVLFIKTLTTPLNLCRFLDTRLHQKRYTVNIPVKISEFDMKHLEEDINAGEMLSIKYLENCSMIHQLLPLKSDLSGISLLIDLTSDPVLTFNRTCEVFREIKFKRRSGDIFMKFYNSNPVLNGIIEVYDGNMNEHNTRSVVLTSKLYDVRIATQMRNARLFIYNAKAAASKHKMIKELIKRRISSILNRIRNKIAQKIKNKTSITPNPKVKRRHNPRPPDRKGKYRVSTISYVEQIDWCIFRRKFEFRVKKVESKQTYSEKVVVKEVKGSWRKIWMAVYWLFLDYKDINKYGMDEENMVDYLKNRDIAGLSRLIEL
jgi:hypothetical protein